MAMNKKEQAEMAALRRQVLVAGAFVRTPSVRPDVAPPLPCRSGPEYTEGFDYNVHTKSVYAGWSASVVHGTGAAPKSGDRYHSASQNSAHLYSTRLLALRALRSAFERKVANELADIDEKIAAELAKEGP